MNIVVIGTVFVDIKGFPFDTFVPDGRNAGTIEEFHGGVGRNIAEDLADIGLSPTFVGLVDRSGAGSEVIRNLEKHGANVRFTQATEDGMGTWLAVFDNRGDVFASISKRPNLLPIIDILRDHHAEIFSNADGICLEIDIDAEVVETVMEYAEMYQVPVYTVISNINIALERREFIRRTSCFVCNIQEAGVFFDMDCQKKTPEEMQLILKEKVPAEPMASMVVTMGSRGAVYIDEKGRTGFCPPQKVDVKDTTGAGDAFFSGVAAGLTRKKSLGDACKIGSRLAAAVISSTSNGLKGSGTQLEALKLYIFR